MASANDTSALQSGLEQFNQAVKDSSSLSLYSAVEFTGLDPSTDCFVPDNYDAFPDAPANAEICYQGFLKPDDGTDYIAYTQETGYTLVFKDNVINHVVIPVGSEGYGFDEKSLKLRVTDNIKTSKTQSLECENLSGQKARCNGSYVVVAAKESGQDMAQALNALYAAIANISSQSVSDALTQAINEAENASMAASQAQSTADKAIADAAAASSKASSVKSELQGSIANNKSAAASAQQTANAASASVADLSKTVTANKTATDSALATKVDATYVTNAIENIPESEPLSLRCPNHHYLVGIDANGAICEEKYLAKGRVGRGNGHDVWNKGYNLEPKSTEAGNYYVKVNFTNPINEEYEVLATPLSTHSNNSSRTCVTASYTSESFLIIGGTKGNVDKYNFLCSIIVVPKE